MKQQDPKHDADAGYDATSPAMLKKENLIEKANKPLTNGEQGESETQDEEEELRLKHDADAGGDASGTAGPDPRNEELLDTDRIDSK